MRKLPNSGDGFTCIVHKNTIIQQSLVRNALREGHSEIVAVGGDGTINEAVNGFFDVNGLIAPDAVFGFVSSGTGCDFRKSIGIAPGYQAAIAHLTTSPAKPIDIGRVTCLSPKGEPTCRYFINIASFGLSGIIVERVNRSSIAKLFGGSFAFAFHSVVSLFGYRNRKVRICVNDVFDEITTVLTVAVANGQYFGGGMHVAPNAEVDDSLFDVVVISSNPPHRALLDMKQIYTGTHISNPDVCTMRGAKIVAAPVAKIQDRPVLVEVDGEIAGHLPATFEIYHACSRFAVEDYRHLSRRPAEETYLP